MVKLNTEKLNAIINTQIENNLTSSLVYNYIVEIGTTDLNALKDTIAYKYLVGLEILEEIKD